ncbi:MULTISPECIES: AIPR family protein [unclassified Thioalkalivibrio]|uniref:AIPR family protein n=1 Tax=unclassified Thioalkalivibrio TaxID=2621013 RepID=UPI000360BCBF|nr:MULTISPECIES: AIPR family protein [unclassified Thioalkalivibrio]
MQAIEEFYHGFHQDVLASAQAGSDFLESQFAEKMAGYLEDAGEIEEFSAHFARDPSGNWRADGYAWDEDTGTFSLFLTDFRPEENLHTLIRTEANPLFNKGLRFLHKAFDRNFVEGLEETSAAFEIANLFQHVLKDIYKINMYVLSNGQLSQRFGAIDPDDLHGIPVHFKVWDLTKVLRLESSMSEREELVIDFEKDFDGGIQCLPAGIHGTGYTSYMLVMPGDYLARLYGQWGSRLLEQNVRNFLQARGKVNKGIRKTIHEEPGMFFAYNNGITATASDVEMTVDDGRHLIRSITNLQIVNGAQTTASLFNALHKDKADLGEIAVQMKLSVVDAEQTESVVPRISRYANSQNKVSEADFFSNHPFHQRIEEISRRLYAPAVGDAQQETKWFYERTKGQYLDKQSHLTPAQKKKFQIEFPRSQVFTKTDLAKFENVWRCIPHTVSLGAQKNFANFADYIDKAWQYQDADFNEGYFREIVAKAIIFRHLEKLVSKQPWYQGGYRANIVAYTISYIGDKLSKRSDLVDFKRIWKQQSVGSGLEEAMSVVAGYVHDALVDTPSNVSNVTEWAKRQACWETVRRLDIKLPTSLDKELVSREEVKQERKEARSTQRIDDGIVAQSRVMELGPDYWTKIAQRAADAGELTEKTAGILKIACDPAMRRIPTERQSQILLELVARLES